MPTGPPEPPLNLSCVAKEYHENFYSTTLSWVEHNEGRQDHYTYTVITEDPNGVSFNTTNNSAALYGLPYNKNITVSVSGHNCIGSSPQVNITFIGKIGHAIILYCM